jgi:hypothetical protein
MRKGQTEDILKTEAHPSHPASEHVSGPLTTSFKDTNRFCFPESWVLSNTFTETDKLSFF